MNRFLVASGCLGSSVVAPLVAQDFEFRRDLAGGSRFEVHNIIGDVRVEGYAGRTVEVTAKKKAGRHGNADDVEIKAVEMTGGVAMCVYYPGQWSQDDDRDDDRKPRGQNPCNRGRTSGNRNNRNDTSVDFVIRIPAGLALELKTVSGDVIGRGLRGSDLGVGSVSGSISLTDVKAATIDAGSVSGDVDLDQIAAKDVSAETVSGDVNYTGGLEDKGAYDFKTLSGDVTITLPKGPNAEVSAVTFSGDVSSDFPIVLNAARKNRHRMKATWGRGGAQLDLESFSGDIAIRSVP